MDTDERIQLKHPDPSKEMPRISKRRYDMVRGAILKLVSQSDGGYLFKDLAEGVSRLLSSDQLDALGSASWYTTSVKLDLEARGLIERIPGQSPQRLRKKR